MSWRRPCRRCCASAGPSRRTTSPIACGWTTAPASATRRRTGPGSTTPVTPWPASSRHDGPQMTYRYFYDCEFIEDGREIYAVSTEFDGSRALPWVRKHVLEKLPSPGERVWRSRERIREDLYAFLVEPMRAGADTELELWAWY